MVLRIFLLFNLDHVEYLAITLMGASFCDNQNFAANKFGILALNSLFDNHRRKNIINLTKENCHQFSMSKSHMQAFLYNFISHFFRFLFEWFLFSIGMFPIWWNCRYYRRTIA